MADFTPLEMQAMVDQASKQATENILKQMGFDTDNLIEVQQDIAYLRRARESSEQVAMWVKRGAVMTALSGIATILWLGFKIAIKG